MKQDQVAIRYAQALFEIAKEKNAIDQFIEELKFVKEALENTDIFERFFKHTKVSHDQKKELIQTSFQGKICDTLLNTLFLLIDKKREGILFKIVEEFTKLADEEQGIAKADVYTAKPLSENEKVAFAATFSKTSNKVLSINNIVDPSIIGGFKVRIGDRIFDGTVLNKLQRIERRMINGNVSR